MTEDNTIDYFLKATWQTVANKYNSIAVKYGFTQAAGHVLINIHKDGTTVSQIANFTGVKVTSLSRVLNNLESLGFIYKESCPKDKRSVKVYLTELGIEKRRLAKDVVRGFNTYIEDYLSEGEKSQLIETLVKINQLAGKYEEELEHDVG